MSQRFLSKEKLPVLDEVVLNVADIPVLSDVVEEVVEAALAQTTMPAPPPEPPAPPSKESLARIELELQAMTRQIVDDIVAAHLPRLEQELRDRLDAQLSRLLRIARR